MSRMIRLAIAVAADKMADVIDAIQATGASAIVTLTGHMDTSAHDDDDVEVEVPTTRKVGKRMAAMSATMLAERKTGGNRGPVVYTPAQTAKQIAKVLDGLRKNTVGAFVLADIVKHPATSKRDMLARLAPKLEKHGLKVDSVDNAVWLLQNKKIVKSVPAVE